MVCSRKSRRALYRIKQLLKFTTVRKQDRKERRNIKRHVKSWEEHLAELRGDEFKRRYRMPQETFNFLLETFELLAIKFIIILNKIKIKLKLSF